MAHNVKMSDLAKRIVVEAQSAFFEGLIEGLQSALSEMQTIAREPINAPMVEPKQKTGFLIEVAAVGSKEDFILLGQVLSKDPKCKAWPHFVYNEFLFRSVYEEYDRYPSYELILFLGVYLSPEYIKIIEGVSDANNHINMMTPMELIRIINEPA